MGFTIGRELEALLDQRARSDLFAALAAGIAHEIRNPLGGIRGSAELLGIRAVPNARVASACAALDLARSATGPGTADEIREAASAAAGVDPEALWALADESGYAIDVSWAAGSPDGSYDVLFRRPDVDPADVWVPACPAVR